MIFESVLRLKKILASQYRPRPGATKFQDLAFVGFLLAATDMSFSTIFSLSHAISYHTLAHVH